MTAQRFKKIGSFSRVRRGASPRPIDDPKYFGGDVGWVRIADVTASKKYLRKTTQYVSELGEKNSVRVDKGDLIMSICGTIGRPVIIDIPACIHDGFVQLYDIKDSDTEFLYYSLQFSEEALKGQGQSGTQTNLNTSIVGDLEIFHPSREEQTSIAAVLSCIDRAIEQSEALIAKQQRIKTGLMQDLLTKGIDEHGNIRSEATHEFKDSLLGRIPKKWDVEKVGSLFDMTLGKMLNKTAKQGARQFPYLANRNVLWDDVDLSDLEAMQFSEAEREKLRLEIGDLLVCEGGAVGRTALWKGEMENCYFQKAIHRLRVKNGKILPEYMLSFMQLADIRGYFINLTSQTSIAHLTQEKLAILEVPLPEIAEQTEIIRIIQQYRQQLRGEQARLTKLQKTKIGLMQDLLTGNVSVEALLAEHTAMSA